MFNDTNHHSSHVGKPSSRECLQLLSTDTPCIRLLMLRIIIACKNPIQSETGWVGTAALYVALLGMMSYNWSTVYALLDKVMIAVMLLAYPDVGSTWGHVNAILLSEGAASYA